MIDQTEIDSKIDDWKNLWDKIEDVSLHTQKGIIYLEKFGQFLKERALIEEEYASKLRNLFKKSGAKKKDEDDQPFTYAIAFQSMLKELEDLSKQHESIAESLKQEIVPDVSSKCRNFQNLRKQRLNDWQELNSLLDNHRENINKMRKNYEKAFKEAQMAHLKYEKAEKNMDISRAELDKTKEIKNYKRQQCLAARDSYRASVEVFNSAKNEHYQTKLPELLESMRLLEVVRISDIKKCMLKSVEVEKNVMKFREMCYENMSTAIDEINPDMDTQLLKEMLCTGYAPPDDDNYIDLGDPKYNNFETSADLNSKRSTISSTSSKNDGSIKSIGRKPSFTLNFFGGGSSQKVATSKGEKNYANLPPLQRCRKLESKIKEIEGDITKKEKEREGLKRMHDAYQSNPKLGNHRQVEEYSKEHSREIARLSEKREKLKRYLNEARCEINTPKSSRTKEIKPINFTSACSLRNTTTTMHSSGIGSTSETSPNEDRYSYSDISVSSMGSSTLGSNRAYSKIQTSPILPFDKMLESLPDSPTLVFNAASAPPPPPPPLPTNLFSQLGIKPKRVEKTESRLLNSVNLNESKASLLEEIQTEAQAKRTTTTSTNVRENLLQEIQAGIKLKHVESPRDKPMSLVSNRNSPNSMLRMEPNKSPRPPSKISPRDVLMNQIKKGPQLKHIDRLEIEKNRKTPNLHEQNGIFGGLARELKKRRHHFCNSHDSDETGGEHEKWEDSLWEK